MRLAIASSMMLCTLCATPALAQKAVPTGSIVQQPGPAEAPENLKGYDQGRIVLMRYADCLNDRKHQAVQRVLALPEQAAAKQLASMWMGECLNAGELRFGALSLRGALFISLYRQKFGRALPALSATPVDFAPNVESPATYPGYTLFVGRRKFADCVIRGNESGAHAVVLAAPTSKAESAAFTALIPDLSRCLTGGVQYRFDKLTLTSLLAEVLYRDALAVVPAANSVTNGGATK